jgi:hypothetical protein
LGRKHGSRAVFTGSISAPRQQMAAKARHYVCRAKNAGKKRGLEPLREQ